MNREHSEFDPKEDGLLSSDEEKQKITDLRSEARDLNDYRRPINSVDDLLEDINRKKR